jgi:membrane-bound serine protease (ClpP class)
MQRVLALTLLGFGFLLGGTSVLPDSADAARPVVYLANLEGPLGPARADLIIRALEEAETAGAAAFVIRMDTPGGLDKSMRELVKRILAAELPVITWVGPDGARAASAGTYIAYASHVAAMAPATNIGSSTPVSLGPAPAMPRPGGTPGADDAPPADDAMTRKVVNDAVAWLQGLAELRGRNVAWAEATVRTGANLRASEALALGVVDLIANDLADLFRQLEGREVRLHAGHAGVVQLALTDARIVEVEVDWLHEILEIISDPAIAYALLIFGVYGIILEFYNPGMIFPSVIGLVCLLLGAYGLQMLPINYAGLALILVGIALMIAEVFTPAFGVLGLAGLVAFVFGSIILLDTESPGYQVPLTVIAAFAVATAGLSVFAIGSAVRARRQPVTTGIQGMIGAVAEAQQDFVPGADGPARGHVFVFGEIWNAECPAPVVKGQRVRVTGIEGLTLAVTPD